MSKIVIAIPARYGSSRFPGKPLVKLAGREMLLRVHDNAVAAAKEFDDVRIVVATEDERIKTFCDANNVECVMTSDACKTGTDRVLEAIDTLKLTPEFVINLQGDNPLCPPWFLEEILKAYRADPTVQVVTPCVKVTWDELDGLRESKKNNPFSGTTVVMDDHMNAFWFSKNIIPAIRKESDLRAASLYAPVHRHVGLYGYSYKALKNFAALKEGYYEKLEGLEQLRFLENHIPVRMVLVDYKGYGSMSGVDSPDDLARAESLFLKHGEFIKK